MIKELIQTALDGALSEKSIYVYEQQKTGEDAKEYVVYTKGPTTADEFADNAPLVCTDSVTIQYYYQVGLLGTKAGRDGIHQNEELIKETLVDAGFILPNGYFDAGDVDDIGYMVTVFECDFQEVV